VTGGETAFALATALGISALELVAEIEAGLVLARSGEGANRRWWAVKPGGFGDAETWVRAWDALDDVR
jgi:4-hydroxythreonine-4-phosphate dehydrogenase